MLDWEYIGSWTLGKDGEEVDILGKRKRKRKPKPKPKPKPKRTRTREDRKEGH
jgi:hypothetical protein|tara:strand:+ start:758 stop:916 length:159 start_codon:yes stop_codon:yes gene_type:complete